MNLKGTSNPCTITLDAGGADDFDPDCVLLYSGGIDSTVLLFDLIAKGRSPLCLGFSYGQRHGGNEFAAARKITHAIGFPFVSTQIATIECGLTSSGELTDPVVPGRNAIFLSLATSTAVGIGAEEIYIGTNKTDRDAFPDCRTYFLSNLGRAFNVAYGVEILAPYSNFTKSEIVKLGREVDAPIEDTWSCYLGRADPCGTCSACIERGIALGA